VEGAAAESARSILIYSTIILPTYVSTEAAFAYLGLGLDPTTTPTLGSILNDSVNYSQSDPTYFFVPGITLVLIVLSFKPARRWTGRCAQPEGDRFLIEPKFRPRQSSRNHDAVAGTARYQGESGMAFARTGVRLASPSARRLCFALAACSSGKGGGSKTGNPANSQQTRGRRRAATLYYDNLDVYSHPTRSAYLYRSALSFATARCFRTLTTFAQGEGNDGTTIVPDMATDLGQRTADAQDVTVTLKPNVKVQDGKAVTCADFKDGISRTFAADDGITAGPTYAMDYLNIRGPRTVDLTTRARTTAPRPAGALRQVHRLPHDEQIVSSIFGIRWPTSTAR